MTVHDRGGQPGAGLIGRSEHRLADWELLTDALLQVLARRRFLRVDEHRRAIESLSEKEYESFPYYGRWIAAIEKLLVEKGVLASEEIERKMAELAAHER